MSMSIPTSAGPYWWRAREDCEWDLVYVREDSTVPGYEFIVLWPETGVEIDLPDMRGQWAKVHSPDEGIEACAVISPLGILQVNTVSQNQSQSINRHSIHDTWSKRESMGYTCELVTIYRKENE